MSLLLVVLCIALHRASSLTVVCPTDPNSIHCEPEPSPSSSMGVRMCHAKSGDSFFSFVTTNEVEKIVSGMEFGFAEVEPVLGQQIMSCSFVTPSDTITMTTRISRNSCRFRNSPMVDNTGLCRGDPEDDCSLECDEERAVDPANESYSFTCAAPSSIVGKTIPWSVNTIYSGNDTSGIGFAGMENGSFHNPPFAAAEVASSGAEGSTVICAYVQDGMALSLQSSTCASFNGCVFKSKQNGPCRGVSVNDCVMVCPQNPVSHCSTGTGSSVPVSVN